MTRSPLPEPASLRTVDGRHVLRMRRRLAHRPEKVWRAVTDPEQIRHWFPAEMRFDLAAGAPVEFSFTGEAGDGGGGTVTAVEPPSLFEYTWDGTVLRWEITPDGDGSILDFIHTFDDRPGAASFAAGWNTCIAALDALLDDRPPPPAGRMVAEHEDLVRRFGLDSGSVQTTADGWRVRFERQLTAPAETAWAVATGGDEPAPGRPAPAGFTPLAGTVRTAEAPRLLEVDGDAGRIRWELTDGTGHGARLVITHTGRAGDPDAAHDRWRAHVEDLAARLAATG